MGIFIFLSFEAPIAFGNMSDVLLYIPYMHLYYLGVILLAGMDAFPVDTFASHV